MPIDRARGTLLCTTAMVAALAGCATGKLSPDPPADTRLEGTWKLNRAASDDPQKIIDRLRADAVKRASRRVGTAPPESGATSRRGESGRGGRGGARPDDQPVEAETEQPRRSPMDVRMALQRSPVMHQLMSTLSRGDFLAVRQTPDQFVLDYGGYTRSFTPGGHSVVSAEGGVGDQFSGWKGKEYVIDVKAQMGPEVVERYSLSPDRKQLVVKLHVGSYDAPGFDLNRVYEPTAEIPSRTLPTND
jgi:hypothetical protein